MSVETRSFLSNISRIELGDSGSLIGSHVSPVILTDSPFPICQLNPNFKTPLAEAILRQAYDALYSIPASIKPHPGKYLALKTRATKDCGF